MRLRFRVRRVAKWAGLTACAVLITSWLVSVWRFGYFNINDTKFVSAVCIWQGAVGVHWFDGPVASVSMIYGARLHMPRSSWRPTPFPSIGQAGFIKSLGFRFP